MLAENSEEETFIKRGKSKISQFKVVADKLAQRSILKLALCEKKNGISCLLLFPTSTLTT